MPYQQKVSYLSSGKERITTLKTINKNIGFNSIAFDKINSSCKRNQKIIFFLILLEIQNSRESGKESENKISFNCQGLG